MEALGKFVAGSALFISGTVLYAYTMVSLWGWFVLPVFTAAPAVTYAQGYGLALLVTYLCKTQVKRDEPWWEQAIAGLMVSLVILGIGWGVHALIVAGWV